MVGTNYAIHCLEQGHEVIVIDNHARGESNYLNERLLVRTAAKLKVKLYLVPGDVANDLQLEHVFDFGHIDHCVHAAAQSSVNVSIQDPGLDFASNVIGTFQLLEMFRERDPETKIIFMASNKVYDVTEWHTQLVGTRYTWAANKRGPTEGRPYMTDAVEPYGASKIAGFYYARCYAAMYNMPIVITVPSGMYGPNQYGKEEQGWLGWFTIASILGLPITIYGDGFQVRDMVHTSDVCRIFDMLFAKAEQIKGEVFNIGGGPANAISLIDALHEIALQSGKMPTPVTYADWRPKDNKVYISNIHRATDLGWAPAIDIQTGIRRMVEWVESEKSTIKKLYAPSEGHYASR